MTLNKGNPKITYLFDEFINTQSFIFKLFNASTFDLLLCKLTVPNLFICGKSINGSNYFTFTIYF